MAYRTAMFAAALPAIASLPLCKKHKLLACRDTLGSTPVCVKPGHCPQLRGARQFCSISDTPRRSAEPQERNEPLRGRIHTLRA